MHNIIQQSIIYLLLFLGVLGNSATLAILKFEKGLRTFTKMIFALQLVEDFIVGDIAADG